MDNPVEIFGVPSFDKMSTMEQAYGPLADSYAQKYGIPTDVFREVIRKVSGFNPEKQGKAGKGIANLNFNAEKTFDPLDASESLDFAARYLSSTYKSMGDWKAALSTFPGYNGDPVFADDTPLNDDEEKPDDTYAGRAVAWLRDKAYGIVLILVAGLLILGSVWMLIKSADKK